MPERLGFRCDDVRIVAALVWGRAGCLWSLGGVSATFRAQVLALYPYETMEGRVSLAKPNPSASTLPVATVQRLFGLDAEVFEHMRSFRGYQFATLHEHAVELFIASAGFGSFRMTRRRESLLTTNLRIGPVPVQPGFRFVSIWSPGQLERQPTREESPLARPHARRQHLGLRQSARLRFLRGPQPYRVRDTRSARCPSQLSEGANLELVSLLLHDKPEVYVSDHLPLTASGQPLGADSFERLGLDVSGLASLSGRTPPGRARAARGVKTGRLI